MNSPSPFFEIGVARSGTTLLSLMLDSHPKIAVPYESHFFVDLAKNEEQVYTDLEREAGRIKLIKWMLAQRYVREWDYVPTIDEFDLCKCTTIPRMIDQLFAAYARAKGKTIWGDKTPLYISHIDILHRYFPNAKYIHVIRDGRDVALSLTEQWFGPNDFYSAIKYWEKHVTIGRKMLAMLPKEQVFELKLEDLVISPNEKLNEICSFLEVPYSKTMLQNYTKEAKKKVGKDRSNRLHASLSEVPKIENVTKWPAKLDRGSQAIAWEVAGQTLEDLGYPSGQKTSGYKLLKKIGYKSNEFIKNRIKKRYCM
ncbi:MAG: sulfotransferase [Oleiphilaceae bacterium]|nr:sulfotransferase [Oleiphilaceae bacterium]